MTLNIVGSRGRTYTTRVAGVATTALLLVALSACASGPTDEEKAAEKAALDTALVHAKEVAPKELAKRGFTDPTFTTSRYYEDNGLYTYYYVTAGNCRGYAAVSGTVVDVTFASGTNTNVTLVNASATNVFTHPELGKVCKATPAPSTPPPAK